MFRCVSNKAYFSWSYETSGSCKELFYLFVLQVSNLLVHFTWNIPLQHFDIPKCPIMSQKFHTTKVCYKCELHMENTLNNCFYDESIIKCILYFIFAWFQNVPFWTSHYIPKHPIWNVSVRMSHYIPKCSHLTAE